MQPSEGGNITSSTLRFQPKVEDMGKVLRCRAENPVMPASQIEDTWTLDVNCKFACIHNNLQLLCALIYVTFIAHSIDSKYSSKKGCFSLNFFNTSKSRVGHINCVIKVCAGSWREYKVDFRMKSKPNKISYYLLLSFYFMKIWQQPNNNISYFGFNFNRKSTYICT